MRLSEIDSTTILAAALSAAILFLPAVCGAQGTRSEPSQNSLTISDGHTATDEVNERQLRDFAGDPKQAAAYKAFHNASEPAKKIRLGQDFINRFSTSPYMEAVYEELAQTYYAKQDITDFYAYADKGISLFPDDVPLLALSGWVIPRAFNRDDPDADKKLDKAETYEKHALEVVSGLKKPDGVSDVEFDQYKSREVTMAHSGLGLVLFRRGQFQNSAKELQAATQGADPDPTDFYVLGADFENLNRFSEAADAFTHCAQIAGTLQGDCKQSADSAMKEAAPKK